jgi:ABC-type multidrug transport system fused ATPase/permease subunit
LQVKAGDHAAVIDPLMGPLGGIAVAVVLFFVAWRLRSGQNTLGDFAAFITALLIGGQPLRALGNLTAHVQRGLAADQRVFLVLDENQKSSMLPMPAICASQQPAFSSAVPGFARFYCWMRRPVRWMRKLIRRSNRPLIDCLRGGQQLLSLTGCQRSWTRISLRAWIKGA